MNTNCVALNLQNYGPVVWYSHIWAMKKVVISGETADPSSVDLSTKSWLIGISKTGEDIHSYQFQDYLLAIHHTLDGSALLNNSKQVFNESLIFVPTSGLTEENFARNANPRSQYVIKKFKSMEEAERVASVLSSCLSASNISHLVTPVYLTHFSFMESELQKALTE